MAKIHHNNYLNTIGELIRDARSRKIVHLFTDEDIDTSRILQISGNQLINFGTCGYLGLETDVRLKDGVVDYVNRYGTQFSVSRTYVTSGANTNLESRISEMYDGLPVIVSSSTSATHISLIPSLVKQNDAVILDQQVHMSVQTAVQLVRPKGTYVEMIRHSNLEMLENSIKQLRDKHEHIWYMIDGVYSMYGDVAPIKELVQLMDKYEQFHVYCDDAHGMSWYGRNGTGYVYDTVGMHPRLILVTTLAKGFGVTGGIAVFPNKEIHEQVKIFGGPLTYSHPIAPPLIGAAIASANIHLSAELYEMQEDLKTRITHCNTLLEKSGLPVISDPLTPIYFIGMGQPRVGYAMVRKLIDDGFYVNIALFPAVPVKSTGVRFTLTRHITLDDITGLVEAMAYHYPKVLESEGKTENDVLRAFKLPLKGIVKESPSVIPEKHSFSIQYETTIKNIDKTEWNKLIAKNGIFGWDGLVYLEQSFSNNPLPEENWDFHYFIIKDEAGIPLLATFFTEGLYKDDLLSPYAVSAQIESKRQQDPYYLTSNTLAMGCLATEGQHIYINRQHPEWKEAFRLLIDQVTVIQEQNEVSNIIFRDFETSDTEVRDFLIAEGFFKIEMPNANVVLDMHWHTREEYLGLLSANSRNAMKRDIFRHEHKYSFEFKDKLTDEETRHFYQLYLNVKARNFDINYFQYPLNMFKSMSDFPEWEILVVKLKPEYTEDNTEKVVAMFACYKTPMHYSTVIIGMDYNYVYKHGVYKQTFFQTVVRAMQLDLHKIYMGFSSDFEKKKLGATQIPRVAYIQAKDNYNLEVIESMSALTNVNI